MSDMTKEQLDAGFIHQVRMYQGVGREGMHRIIDVLFFERGRGHGADVLEACVLERLEKEDLAGILRKIDEKEGK